MASSTPIYKAYVGVIPSAKGFGKNLESELANADLQGAANRTGDRAGRTLGSMITNTFKRTLKIGAVLTAAVGAAAVGGGISRQLNIEDATKKLEGLGHETQNIEKIMNDALASVKGTAYGLDTAATQAAGAVAAGVKPGQDLEKYLRRTADAATIAGVGMDEMGFVFNKVQTGQQAYTEDLNMLADRGIPIFQWLQEEYNVTAEELKKMVSDGKIDAETYFRVIDDNIGGAALKSGETTRGAFKNMLASLSRVGVSLTSGFFPLIREGFVGMTSIFDAIGPKLEEMFGPVWERIAPMFSSAISGMSGSIATWIENFDVSPVTDFLMAAVDGVVAFADQWKANDGIVDGTGWVGFMQMAGQTARDIWDEVTGGIEAFGAAWQANDGDITSSGFPGFMEQVAYWARQVFDAFKDADYSSFGAFADSLTGLELPDISMGDSVGGMGGVIKSVADSFLEIARASPRLIATVLELVATALGFLADNADTIIKYFPHLVAGFVAFKLATEGVNLASQAMATLDVISLPLQIQRNTTSLQAAQARLAAANATRTQTAADARLTATTVRGTIAERARTVAQRASTIAKNAGAIASRALGAAVRFATGPIGLIIIGITALVAGLIWFFTQTELGQKIWTTVWGHIKAVAGAVADWFMNTVVPLLKSAWDAIVDGAMWLWENGIKPAWNGIQAAVSAVADWIMGSLVPWLQSAWEMIGNAASWLYENVISPVWTGIKTVIAIVVTAILLYVDFVIFMWENVFAPVVFWLYDNVIKPVFNKIKDVIEIVVNWILNTAWPALKRTFELIGDAAIWLYDNAIKPAWDWIQEAIDAVVLWIQDTAWPWIQNSIDLIGDGFNWLRDAIGAVWTFIKDNIINPVVMWFRNTVWPLIDRVIGWIEMSFEGWKLILQTIWNFVKNRIINPVVTWFRDTVWPMFRRVVDNIEDKFEDFKQGLRNIWDFIKDRIINPVATWFRDTIKPLFDRVLDGIKEGFNLFRDTVESVWNDVRDTAKKPIKFLIETIIRDNIIKKYNEVANGIFGLDKVDESKFTVGWRKGGILPGYTPINRGDDVLTPMRSGEGVLVSEGLRDPASKKAFLAANAAARRGMSFANFMGQGYKDGGLVKLGMPFSGNYPRGDGFGARGGRHKGIDWPMPSGAVLKAVAAGTANRSWNPAAGNKLNLSIGNGLIAGYHHLSSYIAGRGASVGRGQDIARVGSTGRSSGPHLHFSLKKDGTYVDPMPYLGAGGAAGDGSGGSWWNPFEGLWNSIKDRVREGVGDSVFGDMLFEVPKQLLGKAVDWAKDKLSGLTDWGSDDGGSNVDRWRSTAEQALRMTGHFSTANLDSMMRRMNQESSGNPRAVNNWDSNARAGNSSRGLMQVIPSTFRAFAEKGYSSDIFDPLSNMLAAINYTDHRYPSLRAGWNRSGGYKLGGIVGNPFGSGGMYHGASLMDTGGYLQPGVTTVLNKTGGYETVIPRAESEYLRNLATGKTSAGGDQYIYSPQQVDLDPQIERRTRREFEAFRNEAKKRFKR